MKIIIAPASTHDAIMKQLLQNEQSIFNVSVLTLHAFKERFLNLAPNSLDLKIQAIPIISKTKETCTVLSSSLAYFDHQMSCLTLALECQHLNIPLESLPEDNDKEKDIKKICLAIHPLLSSYDSIEVAVSKLSNDLEIWIHPQPASAIDNILIKRLLETKAKHYPTTSTQGESKIYHALNPALEAHAIAQHIVKHPKLKTSVLCANPSDSVLLTHALNLFNVPYKSTISSSFSPVISAFITALEYRLEPSLDHFLSICRHHLIPHEHTPSLIKFIDTFKLPFETLSLTFNHVRSFTKQSDLFEHDIKNFIKLEKEAEEARKVIISMLFSWSDSTWVEDVYAYLIQRTDLSFDQQSALNQIKSLCESVLRSSLDDHTQIKLLIHQLESVSFHSNQTYSNVMIHDLSQVFVGESDQVILMGASAKHYPPTQKLSGLIDESYLVKLSDYPTLSERNLALVAFEKHLFTQAPLIILSYPSASMEGKPMEVAIDLKDCVGSNPITPWPVARHAINPIKKSHTLSPLTSSKLFFKETGIKGSVSSIEQFFNCSYQYFFNRGLKLSKTLDGGINVAHMGTMMHFVLEKWVNLGMPDMNEPFIMESLQCYVYDTHHLFPYHALELDIIFKLLTKQMLLTIERFKHIEEFTHFKPFKSEVELNEELSILDTTLNFTGFIDRIDHHNNSFRIIDYKSSAKTIKKEKFLTGRQIQLFTYQYLYAKKTKLTPTGVHYYNLKNVPLVAKPKYNFNFRSTSPKYEVNILNHKEYFLSKAKLNGVYINTQTSKHYFDKLERYKFKKDGTPYANAIFLEEGIQEALNVVLKTFIRNLKEGKIEKNPAEPSVCQYCDYQSICHFSGTYPKRPPLYDGDVTPAKKEAAKEVDE
jgi:ATP-dependent helicase/nuclease subunit B